MKQLCLPSMSSDFYAPKIVNSMDMHHDLAQLSSRQKEILGLIASGQPYRQMARHPQPK